MRLFALATCLFVVATVLPQDWTSRGKIDSRPTEIQRRENGQVVGTEFVHFEYRVSTTLVPTDQTYRLWYTWHRNQCRGRKHEEHTKCVDTSCDKVDENTYKAILEGYGVPLKSEMRKMERDSARMARALGMAGGPANWSSASSSYINQMINECNEQEANVESKPHQTPCTHKYREYGQKLTQIKVRGEFWKVGFYRSRGVDTPINQMVGNHEGTVAELWYAKEDPIKETDGVLCKCKAVPPPPDKPTFVDPVKPGGEVPRVPADDGCEYTDENDKPVCPFDDQVVIEAIGQGLNEVILKVDNRCPYELEVYVPSGCELVPENSGTQIMTCTEGLNLTLPAKSTRFVWMRAKTGTAENPVLKLFADPVEGKLKVACTQIDKSQPTSSTRFKLRATNDPRLRTVIDQPSGSSFFANTVTQARVWIYKDGSTREQINKVMIPGVTEGMYLNALYGIARSGVDLTTPKYRKCLDPKLLNSPTASKESTLWFYRELEYMDPKSSEKLRNQALGECRRILGGAPERIDIRHVAHLALAMSDSEDKSTRDAGLSVLEMSVPDALKNDFLTDGGLDVLRSVMTFGEDAEVLKAIGIAKNYRNPDVKVLLEGIGEWGRESIREAAKEAAAAM
jgi:hypothetical protein